MTDTVVAIAAWEIGEYYINAYAGCSESSPLVHVVAIDEDTGAAQLWWLHNGKIRSHEFSAYIVKYYSKA